MFRSLLTLGTTLTLSLGLISPQPVLAQVRTEKYTERCWLDFEVRTCHITDIRTRDGGLDTRQINVMSRGYSVTSGFFLGRFMTWDSRNKRWYRFDYKPEGQGNSRVSPHLVIDSISWD